MEIPGPTVTVRMREARCDASASSALEHGSGAFLLDDERYMNEAFELAERGRGRTHPNPLVGAVLVRDGRVVGRGFHLGPGEPHAEAMALAEAGALAAGATLYCTLEPCSHQGQTPPCADALVAAGVARAVIALEDPNPLVARARARSGCVAGGVDARLAGEELGARARRQNAPFLKFHAARPAAGDLQGRRDARRQGRRRRRRRALDLVPGQPARRAPASRRRSTR